VRLRGQPLPRGEFTVALGQDLEELELGIGYDGAVVEARPKGEDAATGSPRRWILLMARDRSATVPFRRAGLGEDGRFRVTALAPGDYDAYAGDGIAMPDLSDPGVVEQLKKFAVAVHVEAKETVQIEIPLMTEGSLN
jgi:hypothetical protein